MKFTIEKLGDDTFRITLVPASNKKPIEKVVTAAQVQTLASLLITASSASSFKFSLEL